MHVQPYVCYLDVDIRYWYSLVWMQVAMVRVYCCFDFICIASLPCVAFFHFIVQWTVPTITGDIPPPLGRFTFTKISSSQGAMFGGHGLGGGSSDLRIATVSRDSVVSMSITLDSSNALHVCSLAIYSALFAY